MVSPTALIILLHYTPLRKMARLLQLFLAIGQCTDSKSDRQTLLVKFAKIRIKWGFRESTIKANSFRHTLNAASASLTRMLNSARFSLWLLYILKVRQMSLPLLVSEKFAIR